MNFLQGHYNQIRKAGGSMVEYSIVNDLSDETMTELEQGYVVVRACGKCDGLGFLADSKGDVVDDCRCWKKWLMSEGRSR